MNHDLTPQDAHNILALIERALKAQPLGGVNATVAVSAILAKLLKIKGDFKSDGSQDVSGAS